MKGPSCRKLNPSSNKLHGLEAFHLPLATLTERLQSVQIELQDIAGEIESINNEVFYDIAKINLLNERMAEGYRLLKKHGVTTTAELLAIKERLSAEVEKITNLADTILAKEKEVQALYSEALKIAEGISVKRQKQVKPFEEKVNGLLSQVGMPNAQLKVEIFTSGTLNFFGNNTIEFLFDANVPAGRENKTNRFEPLRKVASGGELSRLMLSIKSLVAKSIQLPVLIFDEIDSGISGEAARQVGMIMKDLSVGSPGNFNNTPATNRCKSQHPFFCI